MVTNRMNRCYRISLLTAALSAALPLYAGNLESEEQTPSPTELATVRVQAKTVVTRNTQSSSFGGGDWKHMPASVSTIDRALLDSRHVRSLSELANNDASLGDSYAPVGYYQNVAIRGFALDTATGYRFNGLSIAGEQRLALENVQQVEILKGEAGLAAGVMAPGGLINYVGKRPDEVRSVTLGTDSEGTRYSAIDAGHWITPRIGLRFNAAWEDSGSYVEHADGRRNFYSLASDWLISERSKLEVDANYQSSAQRSASAYQLLGGDTLPGNVDPKHMLAYQAWQRPVGIDSTNLTALHTYDFTPAWQSRVSASYSRTVIDDNVAFAYGCYYAEPCWDGSVPGNYFAPNGDYDIYDYRSPDDTRRNQQLHAELRGRFQTGAISHQITVGGDRYTRTVDRRQNVNEYVGTGNIHDNKVPQFTPSPLMPGASVRRLDNEQRSLFMLDRMQFGSQWQWLAGGRFVQLDERARDKRGNLERDSKVSRFLPQTALIWNATEQVNLYASYVRGISLGQEAPFWTNNEGQFLPSVLSTQTELGAKYTPSEAVSFSAALFRISRPFQYAMPDDSGAGYTFIEQGRQTHTGLELTAHGQLTPLLRINASTSLLQARVRDTGTAAYEGHSLVNVPKARASLHANYQLPFASNVSLAGGWRYASSNAATADGRVRVPAYHVVDAGLQLRQQLGGHALRWNLSVDNVFNRFYWRDTGSSGGDDYLFPGAPRQARLSVSIDL
jgi:iron complex outermembrane receptor protein